MPDPEYAARLGQPLAVHLDGVATNARRLTADEATTPAGNELTAVVDVVAQLHDVGKYTSYFQDYLAESGQRSPTLKEQHADVGAVLTYLALAANDHPPAERVAGFYAVLRHHGTIPNLETYQEQLNTSPKRFSALEAKLQDIDAGAPAAVETRLTDVTDGRLTWDKVPTQDVRAHCREALRFTGGETFYPLVLRIWSTLNCADKLDAAGIPVSASLTRPDADAIHFDHDASGITRTLNERRTTARRDAVETLTDAETPGVFTLTLPTGFGKTFAGLEAALTEADEQDSRVIYALPYTTVIDQVDDEIQHHFDVSPTSEAYTIHHHLADTQTQPSAEAEKLSTRAEAMYGETWQAGLVLTTFVQLFESLAGPGNVQSMKLPALQNSVVVVDEPQAIPREWWHLVSRLATVLVEEYNASLVLMTATQPRFINEYNFDVTTTELIQEPAEYFEFLDVHERVQFSVGESLADYLTTKQSASARPLTRAATHLTDVALADGVDCLAVNNTVTSAAAMHAAIEHDATPAHVDTTALNTALLDFVANHRDELLSALRGDASGHSLSALAGDLLESIAASSAPDLVTAALTAALRPLDRALLIEAVRQLVDNETQTPLDTQPLLVSATQLVEAGVDVSFDRVYRDFAPLPSIVQAAGRCNRSFDSETGEVTLWRLDSIDDSRPPAEQTYGGQQSRLEATRTTLQSTVTDHGRTIPEAAMVSTVIDAYYDHLHAGDHTRDSANELVRWFEAARGDNLRDASLIDDTSTEFLVLTSDTDVRRLETYLQTRDSTSEGSDRSAFGALTYLLASRRIEDPSLLDATDQVLSEIDVDIETVEEFPIVDARSSTRYSVRHGRGLYPLPG